MNYDVYLIVITRSIYLVDCVWDEWVTGECSKTCGHGIQTDTREEFQPALFGGLACEGEGTQQSECLIKDCPSINIF